MSTTDTDKPSCPLCASFDTLSTYNGRNFYPYSIQCCQQCGMSFLSPRPTQVSMLAHYEHDNYFFGTDQGYVDYAAQEPALRATFRRLLSHLSLCGLTGGRLLEVGCGYGYLLDEARQYFDYRVGTDFSAGAVQFASIRADLVIKGGIDSVAPDLLFDCVVAAHVIEHVYHPQDFIREALKRLRTGGTIVIATPDYGSFWRKLMGSRWPSFKLPEHILYFNRDTLTQLLEQCGLVSIELVPYPHAFPLGLIASKFGLQLPKFLNKYNLWLPATTVAIMGRKGG